MKNRIKRLVSNDKKSNKGGVQSKRVPLETIIRNIHIPRVNINLTPNSSPSLTTKINILHVDCTGEKPIGLFKHKKKRIEIPIGIKFMGTYSEQCYSMDESGALNFLGNNEDTLYLILQASGIATEFVDVKEEDKDKTHNLGCLGYSFAERRPLFFFMRGQQKRRIIGYYVEDGELKMCIIKEGEIFSESDKQYDRLKSMLRKEARIILPGEVGDGLEIGPYQPEEIERLNIDKLEDEIQRWMNGANPEYM